MEKFWREIEDTGQFVLLGERLQRSPRSSLDAAMAAVTGSLAHRHATFTLSVTIWANVDRAQKARNRQTLPKARPVIVIDPESAGRRAKLRGVWCRTCDLI